MARRAPATSASRVLATAASRPRAPNASSHWRCSARPISPRRPGPPAPNDEAGGSRWARRRPAAVSAVAASSKPAASSRRLSTSDLPQRPVAGEHLGVQLFPRPPRRARCRGDGGLDRLGQLCGTAPAQRAGDAHVGDLAGGGHDELDQPVRRVDGHRKAAGGLVELRLKRFDTAIALDGLLDPAFVDLTTHKCRRFHRTWQPDLRPYRPGVRSAAPRTRYLAAGP